MSCIDRFIYQRERSSSETKVGSAESAEKGKAASAHHGRQPARPARH